MRLISCILMGSLCALPTAAIAAKAPAPASASQGLHLNWLDKSVSPAQNFFEYADGGWQKTNPIPAAYSRWGTFNILQIRNQQIIRQILENAAQANAAPGSTTQKVGDFYASGMDTALIDKEGAKPLASQFNRIAAIGNLRELQREVAHLQLIGVNAMFYFGSMQDFKDSSKVIAAAFQGGLGLPDRDYYLKTAAQCEATQKARAAETAMSAQTATAMKATQAAYAACTAQAAKFQQVRDAYLAHVAAMFELLGDTITGHGRSEHRNDD